jgi:putative ABC transport system substrate-binding protein
MRRREFMLLLTSATAAWSVAAHAQRPTMPVIGLLGSETPELFASRWRAVGQGLAEAGFAENRNVIVEYRWAHGENERLAGLAADLVQRQVSVIVTPGEAAVLAAKAATTTIPIVFRIGADPVAMGIVASLNRPGGNITGMTGVNIEIGAKRVQVLHELVPNAKIIALLVNPANPSVAEASAEELQVAVRTLGLKLHVVHASAESEFDAAFAELTARGAKALIIGNDLFFGTRGQQLSALSARHAVPTISAYRSFALAGDLASYGVDIPDQYRLVGVYTGRILKGEKPTDLPVQRAAKFELVINLKTAKMLGLEVSATLLALADQVIE